MYIISRHNFSSHTNQRHRKTRAALKKKKTTIENLWLIEYFIAYAFVGCRPQTYDIFLEIHLSYLHNHLLHHKPKNRVYRVNCCKGIHQLYICSSLKIQNSKTKICISYKYLFLSLYMLGYHKIPHGRFPWFYILPQIAARDKI